MRLNEIYCQQVTGPSEAIIRLFWILYTVIIIVISIIVWIFFLVKLVKALRAEFCGLEMDFELSPEKSEYQPPQSSSSQIERAYNLLQRSFSQFEMTLTGNQIRIHAVDFADGNPLVITVTDKSSEVMYKGEPIVVKSETYPSALLHKKSDWSRRDFVNRELGKALAEWQLAKIESEHITVEEDGEIRLLVQKIGEIPAAIILITSHLRLRDAVLNYIPAVHVRLFTVVWEESKRWLLFRRHSPDEWDQAMQGSEYHDIFR